MKARRVLVTGGAKGIGRAIVGALADAGYDVDFTCRASADAGTELIDELKTAFPQQSFGLHTVDLADRGAVEAFAAGLLRAEPLHGLVHNAGASYDSLAATIDQDRALALMQVNFWSLTRLAAAALRPMMRARSGRIVAIGSVTAWLGTQGNAAYAASKAAMAGYMRTLAIEVASRGITANTIAPGFVDTGMLAAYEARRERFEAQIPAGRFARAEEIAGLVRYLLSPEAAYITGTEITIDGGLSAVTPARIA
jgi:NAD(P)-dependent dehydrogenase (short-subunit alcohol dehydrogenase family)